MSQDSTGQDFLAIWKKAQEDFCDCEQRCSKCGRLKRQELGPNPWLPQPYYPTPYYPAYPYNPWGPVWTSTGNSQFT